MPIHPIGEIGRKGEYGSPYAIRDYERINPDLGDEESFRELINQAHALGMKVIIDVVYNHTSCDSVLTRSHPQWFIKNQAGELSRKIDDWSDVYDLDYSHPELWDYLIGVLEKWLDFGVDGFRCDVASLVPVEFWLAARERLNRKKEVIWLAESVEKCFIKRLRDMGYGCWSDPELHEAFDLTYDYDGYEYLKAYYRGETSLEAYLNHLYVQETLYPAYAVKMRFLENHDQPRIAQIVGRGAALRNWTVFYSLLPGAMLIYAGQETANDHWPNLFEKDPVDWSAGDPEFTKYFTNVIRLAKEVKLNYRFKDAVLVTKGVVRLTWVGKEDRIVAIVNLENRYGRVPVDFAVSGKDLLTGEPKLIQGRYCIEREPVVIRC